MLKQILNNLWSSAKHPIDPGQFLVFQYRRKNFLIVVDYYSKFVELAELVDMIANTLVKELKKIFARYGIPDLLYTDNGSNYINAKFKIFIKEWDFRHKTSSPNYQQSNGLAKSFVQTIKNILKKACDDNKNPVSAILEFRRTPIDSKWPSPAEILFGRKIEGLLPNFDHNISNNDLKDI